MKKRYIYIIQMHTGTLPARFIKVMTRYKYSHVGISLCEECDYIYTFGRKRLHNFLHAGFVVQTPSDKFFEVFKNTKCRIYRMGISEAQYNKLKKNLENVRSHSEEYKYDFFGEFLRYFKIPVCFEKRYVCTQFVAEMLENADIYKFNRKPCFAVPKDFENLADATEIYRGKYPMMG